MARKSCWVCWGGLLHRKAKTGLVIGMGTGETAGWLAEVPSIDCVDLVEIEPAVDEMARRRAAVNHDVLHHPKVRRIYNDAHEVLQTSSARYDLVVSEPSNPYRAGVAALFTQEFYGAVRGHLQKGGLFVQWLQSDQIEPRTVETVLATLRSVFDHVEVWNTESTDLALVASMEPVSYPVAALRRKIAGEPFRSALVQAWCVLDLEG